MYRLISMALLPVLLFLAPSLGSAAVTWTEHEGDYYTFAGTDLEFTLSFFSCYAPICRVLSLPPGATVEVTPDLTLLWTIPPELRGRHAARHQICQALNEPSTPCIA